MRGSAGRDARDDIREFGRNGMRRLPPQNRGNFGNVACSLAPYLPNCGNFGNRLAPASRRSAGGRPTDETAWYPVGARHLKEIEVSVCDTTCWLPGPRPSPTPDA